MEVLGRGLDFWVSPADGFSRARFCYVLLKRMRLMENVGVR